MKGIYKGFKYTLSQMFVVKEEREIEIGYPTDVKHVAHIGWGGPSGSAPNWMNEFKTGPNFAAASIGNMGAAASPWSTRDLQSLPQQSSTGNSNGMLPEGAAEEVASTQKKQKRKKAKSTSSPKAGCSTSRSSRMGKSKSKFMEGNAKLTNIEVA